MLLIIVAALPAADTRRHPSPNASAANYVAQGRAIAQKRTEMSNGEAIALFGKALAIDPDCVPALLGYALVKITDVMDGWTPRDERWVRLDEAEVAIERALKPQPGNAAVHSHRGELYRSRHEPDRAIAAFEHALRLNPVSAWTYAMLGRAKIEVGRSDEAIDNLEAALRLSANEPARYIWYNWAGLAAIHLGDFDTAVGWLMKARQLNPAYPYPTPLLAIAYAELGREAEGRALMAGYVAKTPGFSIPALEQDWPRHNALVAAQRDRIFAVLRRLGVPEGPVRSVRG